MLSTLLAGRSAQLLLDAVPSASCLLSFCSCLHSKTFSTRSVTVVSEAELSKVPRATLNADSLLDSAQLETLAIFKRYNIAQQGINGQVILAKVLQSRASRLLVDPGFYGLNWVMKKDLGSLVSYDESGKPIQKPRVEILPGEYVKVRVTAIDTPYGDMQLDPIGIPPEVRQTLVWQELEHRMRKGRHVTGRILNPTVKGYAVGVAGYVALVEHAHVTPNMAQQIGTLQDFYVHTMSRDTRKITLSVKKNNQELYDSYRASM